MAADREKILLIDDDPFFRRILSDAFSGSGFRVVTADDGVEGVEKFKEVAPDVVVSDLVMPRMGGVSACMEINRIAGDRNPIVILLTSMFQEPPHEHESLDMGAKVHIPKSTDPVDIVILVEQLLDRRKFTNAG